MNDIDHPDAPIVIKINVPDKGIFERKFTFKPGEKVWAAKEQVIHEIGKESKDIQNYGFFVPPYQGKAGKFMDEGRPLSEYSLPGDDQSLEFMLKRRVYRSITYDESKLTKIHTKANLKKLMELVELNNAGQVNQFLEKGLDPNFHDPKTGETPLTTAAVMENVTEVIMFLINGGAYMDFRNRNGLTAVHKAAAAGKAHNVKAFLDLGASPNYRDLKGLTPLYHACLSGVNPQVAELLLSDQSDIGVVDSQEWQEIHQVCRYGHIQHLEQLIFYGVDLNAKNGSGNSPLHICALYNQVILHGTTLLDDLNALTLLGNRYDVLAQLNFTCMISYPSDMEECARLLLYRGARRDIVNFANQTAEMVAVVATNVKLSEFIRNYSEKDVVPYIDKPTYSTRRRTQSKSRPTANSVFLRDSTDKFIFCSETLSTNSSTSLHSEASEPMSLDLSPKDTTPAIQTPEERSPTRKYKRTRTLSGSGSDSSYATDSGDETGGSAVTSPVHEPTNNELSVQWRTYSLSSLNKEERSAIPRVKEVKGAAHMVNSKSIGKSHSRKLYVAVRNFTPTQAGELSLAEGDVIEVVTKGEKGYWQGSVDGKTGWFPAECIGELKKRKHRSKNALQKPPSVASSLNKSNTSLDQAPTTPVVTTPQPRQVILNKVKAGFGFQMRGANAPTINKLEFQPSGKIPALQYVGEVERGGEAEKRGLKKGDYILEVNGDDVRTASHRHVVSLIRKTGQNLIMKVISVEKTEGRQMVENNNVENAKPPGIKRSNSLPSGKRPGVQQQPPMLFVNGTTSVDGGRDHKDKKPPPVPSRDPKTSLSRPYSDRHSVTDVDFEKPRSTSQEDRIISVPRERISPTDTQWQSPLTGHHSLPRRPKSSYGAIIGSIHDSPENQTQRNYYPVDRLDNTGFTTLPSKPTGPTPIRQVVRQDDTLIDRRREGSRSKDRPKSWMPKVLPTAVPATQSASAQNEKSADELVRRTEEMKASEQKKDKKRRFSFKKKKEKDYTAAVPTVDEPPADEDKVESGDVNDDVVENLHIEDETTRPNSLPGLHKRLSTFKPVTAHHRHTVENPAVSPELSQALEKRMTRIHSDGSNDLSPPAISSPHGNNPPVPVLPPTQPPAKAPKSLEESIQEEMRRRANTAPSSGIPKKPRRTFEYKRSSDDQNGDAGESEAEPKNGLDFELAKAIAKRAEKLTSAPAQNAPIYENVKLLTETNQSEPRSSVEEPPTSSIEEKLKMLHMNEEVLLPTKFKPPVQPPPVKIRPESTSHGKAPPKTFPKPKRKPSNPTDNSANEVTSTPRPVMTLPLSADHQLANLPPPVLSPEMVATQFLDDVIDEEVKNSNWDTTSWKDKDWSSPKSSVSSSPQGAPEISPQDSASGGKKKYVYKITLVTETPADGSSAAVEHTQVVKVTPGETSTKKHKVLLNESELPPPPPPPPPLEFTDDSPGPFSSPVFTPPNSPPPPLLLSDTPPSSRIPPPETQEPLRLTSKEPSPSVPEGPPPSVPSEPPSSVPSEPPPPVPIEPLPIQQDVLTIDPQGPPSHVVEEPPPPVLQEPPPSISQSPPLSIPQQLPPPVPQEPPPPDPQETAPSIPDEPTPPVPQEPVVSDPQEPAPFIPDEAAPPVLQEAVVSVPQESPLTVPQEPPSTVPKEPAVPESQEPTEPESCVSQPLPVIPDPLPSSEESSKCFSSSLPAPVLPPETETRIAGASVNETSLPEECKETKLEGQVNSDNVVVPPAVFADQSSEADVITTTVIEEKSPSLLDQPESVVDVPEKTLVVETKESKDNPVMDVLAPPGDTDQNKNFVEPPAMYSGVTEELALSKPVASEVSTNSSDLREIPYEKWTCVHVCQWLDSIGMGEHRQVFEENDIRGQNLLGLTKEDLRELGVKKLGHRMTIADEVKSLTSGNGNATSV